MNILNECDKMKKRVKVDKRRLERFSFEPVREIKASLEERPIVYESLREDIRGTLESEGITVDEAFKNQVRAEWMSTINSDIRKVVNDNPKSRDWYLKRVLEEKPIKLSVKVDKETGKHEKTLRRSQ